MNIARSLEQFTCQTDQVPPASFPASRSEVTEHWILETLKPHPRFIQDPIESATLRDFGDGIGQLSALTLVDLTCASGSRCQLVIKLQASVPEMHQVALNYGHYETEVNFYAELAADIPMRTPEIYVSAMDHQSDRVVLIMEAFTDWHSPDQIAGASGEQVAIAASELAGLASTYWNAPLKTRFPWLRSVDSPIYAGIPADFRACLPVLLARFNAHWPAHAAGTLTAIGDHYASVQQAIARGNQVLSHWDYRVENLFFGPDGQLAVIDWQLMQMNNPANDLAYLLTTNVDVALRREIETEVMAIFLKGLREHGIKDYGMAELVSDYRLALLGISPIPVIGGANSDIENERSQALFATMGARLLTAIEDWRAVELLSHL